jgi:hypothetical protein
MHLFKGGEGGATPLERFGEETEDLILACKVLCKKN